MGLSCPVASVIPEVLGITVQIVSESEVDCGGLHAPWRLRCRINASSKPA